MHEDEAYRVRGNVCQLNKAVGTGDEIRPEVTVERTGHYFVVLGRLEALLRHVAVDGGWGSGATYAPPRPGTKVTTAHG